LHAQTLGFKHPRTGEFLTFNAPLPEIFEKILKELRDNK
jgi:23S rRNA pseudouridine1911/1915/1917 synthase